MQQILTRFFLSEPSSSSSEEKKEPPKPKAKDEEMEVDYSNVTDTDFLKSVLEQLPGVDPQNQEVQDALKSTVKDDSKDKDKDKKKDTKK